MFFINEKIYIYISYIYIYILFFIELLFYTIHAARAEAPKPRRKLIERPEHVRSPAIPSLAHLRHWRSAAI